MAWPEEIAIVGAGYMGRGIAEVFALHGAHCVLADLTAERAASAAELLLGEAARHEHDGLTPDGSSAELRSRIRSAHSIEDAVGGADYVVEAVFENRATKTDVLRRIEGSLSRDAVISSNTSAISIRTLSEGLDNPARFLGAHWFNPPQFVPGVELIPCPQTAAGVLDAVEALLTRAGKTPARVADSPGFVGNRLQYALFQEAAAVVEEGIASAESVDQIVRSTFGFRLPIFGPFAIADMAGLDVYGGAYQVLVEGFPDRFAVPAALRELVESGSYGAKTGSGFVIRSEAQAAAMAARRDRAYVALGRVVDEFERDEAPANPAAPGRDR